MNKSQFLMLAIGIAAGFTVLALVTGSLRDGGSGGALIWGLAGACSLLSLVISAFSSRKAVRTCRKSD